MRTVTIAETFQSETMSNQCQFVYKPMYLSTQAHALNEKVIITLIPFHFRKTFAQLVESRNTGLLDLDSHTTDLYKRFENYQHLRMVTRKENVKT